MKALPLIVSAAMAVSPIPAVSSESTGPLPPGRAAGVQQAQAKNPDPIFIAGAGVVIAIGVLLLMNNNNEGGGGGPRPCCTTTTTTTTP